MVSYPISGSPVRAGVLEDVTDRRVNIKLQQPSLKFKTSTPQILGVHYSPIQRAHLSKLLHSPHRAQVLHLKGLLQAQSSAMYSGRHDTLRETRIHRLAGMDYDPTPGFFKKGKFAAEQAAAVDKLKEQKTALSTLNSDDNAVGQVSDGPFSETTNMMPGNHSVAKSSRSTTPTHDKYSPSKDLSDSDAGSFKITPSLCSDDYGSSGVEFGIASAVHVVAVVKSTKRNSLHDNVVESQFAANSNDNHVQRKPVARKGNPHDISGIEALSQSGRVRVDEAKEKEIIKAIEAAADIEQAQIAEDDAKKTDNNEIGPETPPKDVQNTTPQRRAVKYGVGPTVRFSKDAHEVIMGPGEYRSMSSAVTMGTIDGVHSVKPREIKLQLGPVDNEGNNRKGGSPTQLSTHTIRIVDIPGPKSAMQSPRSPFPARTSSHPSSSEYTAFADGGSGSSASSSSFTARMSRPTAASQARSAESKKSFLKRGERNASTINTPLLSPVTPRGGEPSSALQRTGGKIDGKVSGKGLRNRLTTILKGRRNDQVNERSATVGYNPLGEVSHEFVNKQDLNYNFKGRSASRVSRNLTTYENSGMDDAYFDDTNIGCDDDKFGAPVDRVAKKEGDHDRKEREIVEDHAHEVTSHLIAGIQSLNSHRGGRLPNNGGDDPEEPRGAADINNGHYTEDTTEIGTDQTNSEDDSGLTTSADDYLGLATANFDSVARIAHGINHPEIRTRVTELLVPMEDAIRLSREARMAVIRLTQANAELAEFIAEVTALSNRSAQAGLRLNATGVTRHNAASNANNPTSN